MKPTIRWLLLVTLVLAGCGDAAAGNTDAAPSSTATTGVSTTAAPTSTTMQPAGAEPIRIESAAGSIELTRAAQQIAALSATHVEMLFAMGAGSQVIAGDLFSNHPAEAARLPQLDSFNLSVESVIDLEPDLVVLTFDPGDAVAAFEAVGIPTLLYPPAPTLEAAYEQIRGLGAATGRVEAAAQLVGTMTAALDEIQSSLGDDVRGLTYYHETDPFSFYTPNSASFIGQLYALLGMENIADAAPDEFGSGYPQLSPEFIIESDPDVIFLGGGDGSTLESVIERDGWASMSAVMSGRVFAVDADASSRWGPRVVDFLTDVADALTTMKESES